MTRGQEQMVTATEKDCDICAVAAAVEEAQVVHRGATLTAATAMDVPGWFLIWTNRHDALGLWALRDDESVELGLLLRDLGGAVHTVCGAERAYVLAFGERALHFHAMVQARTPDIAEDARGPHLLGTAPSRVNPDEARRIAALVRAELAPR
jgi:diadenosine tetraphosphate (Ap4A) HIT family hydrolase